MTPNDIILLALKMSGVLGVGQQAQAEDISDCVKVFNMMLGQWAQKRWLVYHLLDLSVKATGALSYTVGPGGDFDTPRPDRLEAGFLRQPNTSPNPVDYPLELLQSREDYNRITIKGLGSFPLALWYDPAFPLGNVYFWPLPSSQYEMHITVKAPLISISSATLFNTVQLPDEYLEALYWNLAVRLRPMYQLPPEPTITALAISSLNTIRNSNTAIPQLTMPRGLMGRGSSYNIFSDT